METVREKYIWLNDYYNRVFCCGCETEEEKRQLKERRKKEFEVEEKRLKEIFEREPEQHKH